MKLTENKIRKLIREMLLTEGKDRKQQARKKTKNVIRQHFNNWDGLNQPNDRTGEMNLIDFLEQKIIVSWFDGERSSAKGTFIVIEPLVAKIALENGWEQGNPNQQNLTRLTNLVNYIFSLYQQGKVDMRTIPLDGNLDTLNEMFGKQMDSEQQTSRQNMSTTDYGGLNQNYTIKVINSFKEAHEIGNYSVSGGELCYTQGESTWDNFTNKGWNKVYCCLSKDWQNIPEEHTKSLLPQYPNANGYDRYGLSMIFVFVNPEGDLNGSNTRWNHEANYGNGRSVDQAFTEEDLSKLMGVAFTKLFVPWTAEERREKGITANSDIKGLLARGVPPEDIFDEVDGFINGFARVRLDNNYNKKYNFINTEGNLLSDQWFDVADSFDDGFAYVVLDNKYNYLKTDGEVISDQWFDDLSEFIDGFAFVKLNGKYNHINTEGNFLSDQWFDEICDFSEGFALVGLRDGDSKLYNYINTKGELLNDEWFDEASNYFNNGIAAVAFFDFDDKLKWNYINTNGKGISKLWFDVVTEFNEQGYALVVLNNKWMIINKNGESMSGNWRDFNVYYGNYKIYKPSLTKEQILYRGYNYLIVSRENKIVNSFLRVDP